MGKKTKTVALGVSFCFSFFEAVCLDEIFGLERWFFPYPSRQRHRIWESSLANYTL